MFRAGVYQVGYEGDAFHFDNEGPRHRQFVETFQLAPRLVTIGEYLEFVEDGGYRRPEFWLSLGWYTVNEQRWEAPLYWEKRDGSWSVFTLGGMRELDKNEPVCHVSYFEADAFARWTGARLPTEFEWEVAAADLPYAGNFVDKESFHPRPLDDIAGVQAPAQMFGDVWEWTSSSYSPYPSVRTGGRRARRIQWQIHVQSVRPARRLMRHLAVTHTQNLPQFFSAKRTLAVHGNPPGQRVGLTRSVVAASRIFLSDESPQRRTPRSA